MSSLRICQVIASINRSIGGPAVSVPRLAEVLSDNGLDSALATLDYPEHGRQTQMRHVKLISQKASWLTRHARGFSPQFRRQLITEVGKNMDIIHSHGLWMFPNRYACQTALRHHIPLVISPRGMLEHWALKQGRQKKLFVWHLFEKNNFAAAQMFHVTSEVELESLRAAGATQPAAVIPNGIDLPDTASAPPREHLTARYPELKNRQWLLSMSRLHPKKGVFELLTAWRGLEKKFPDWHLVLAGPDLDGYGRVLRDAVHDTGLVDRVTFTGMLVEEDKACALSNAGLFVLATHSENFGLVIGEALAFGTPVITTHAAPWHDLETRGCGWWIENKPETLVTTLAQAMSLSIDERCAMGRKGRQLVADKYDWHRVGEQMKTAYLWCCGREAKPDCIHQA
jgi:glycosyltransferase involved in cell wall biosynthesis